MPSSDGFVLSSESTKGDSALSREEVARDANEVAGPEVMTVEEAAVFLRVNVKSLYEAINRGDIPCQFIGKVRRLYRPALVEWLSQGQGRTPRSTEKKS